VEGVSDVRWADMPQFLVEEIGGKWGVWRCIVMSEMKNVSDA
jgi:hypothetical protein